MDPARRDFGDSAALGSLWNAIARLPRPCVAGASRSRSSAPPCIVLAPRPLWENNLAELTPVPADLLAVDQELRARARRPPDLRYMLAVDAPDDEAALAQLESLDPRAASSWWQRGAIAGFDHAARYVPSAATQRARQASLPDSASLRAALDAAQRCDAVSRPACSSRSSTTSSARERSSR